MESLKTEVCKWMKSAMGMFNFYSIKCSHMIVSFQKQHDYNK